MGRLYNFLHSLVGTVKSMEGSIPKVDGTLTQSGQAADAKVTGDAILTLSDKNDELKGDIAKIYDVGQLLDISSETVLHPTGDGTVSVIATSGFDYSRVTAQANYVGFSFDSTIGKEYTASFAIKNGSVTVYAVKNATFSSSKYLAKTDTITESGKYSITFIASTDITTIWFSIPYTTETLSVRDVVCSDGWKYRNLDADLSSERFPAQGKAVGAIATMVEHNKKDISKIIVDNNLAIINENTLQHTAGDAVVAYDTYNGFTTNNVGNTNNLYGFVVDTQAKVNYKLHLTVDTGTVQSMLVCPSDIYNASGAIKKLDNIVGKDEIEIEFSAVTEKTSVWINQRYNIKSISVSNIVLEDEILRYNKYIMDYDGDEISTFNKILCIGDSITEGTFNYTEGGSSNNVVVYTNYSYPTYLKKLTGCEVSNYGYGGDTAASWYNRYKDTDLSGHDACIIMLGINDGVQSVGVDSFRTNMTSIINKVKSENTGIKVFVATIVPAYSDYNSKFDAYIAETKRLVSEDFTDAFLIDINKYSKCKYYTYFAQGHLTAIGYQQLAKEFKTLISYTMKNNMKAFRNIQFIGTDKTYDEYF